MDRMRACGVCDVGSIPTEGTKINKVYFCARKKPTVWLCVGSEKLFVIYEKLVLNKSKRYTVPVRKDYPTEDTKIETLKKPKSKGFFVVSV